MSNFTQTPAFISVYNSQWINAEFNAFTRFCFCIKIFHPKSDGIFKNKKYPFLPYRFFSLTKFYLWISVGIRMCKVFLFFFSFTTSSMVVFVPLVIIIINHNTRIKYRGVSICEHLQVRILNTHYTSS